VRAAKNLAILLHAMSHDMTSTMLTYWSQLVNRTLKRVERVPLFSQQNRKRLVVVVAADFALHGSTLSGIASAN
jgi:hypothetical protein